MKPERKALFAQVEGVKIDTNWMQEVEEAISREEEIRANNMIVLRIRRYMKENGLKQVELAAKLGVSPQYIHKLLNGLEPNIGVATAIRYGKILGIKLIEIVGLDDAPKQHLPTQTIKCVITINSNTPSYETTVSKIGTQFIKTDSYANHPVN